MTIQTQFTHANAERLLTTLAQVRQGDGAARTNEAH